GSGRRRFGCGVPLGSARPRVKVADRRPAGRTSIGLFTAPAAKVLPAKALSVNHVAMDGERIAQAMARIEAAAQRIEAAARRPASDAGDPGLARKYEALRSEAGAALADLDRLIGALEA